MNNNLWGVFKMNFTLKVGRCLINKFAKEFGIAPDSFLFI